MKTKLWLFFIAFGLIFSACEKEDDFRGGPPPHAKSGAKDQGSIIFNDEAKCEISLENGIAETDLIAGQNINVGTVTVDIGTDYITVTYETNPGWIITETHLHIAGELAGIPVNNPGNPMVGHFKYGSDDLFTNEFKVEINKDDIPIPYDWDGCYYVAAHAVVEGVISEERALNVEAFFASLSETCSLKVDGPVPGGSAYFPKVYISDANFAGEYPGWCIETQVQINPGTLYEATVHNGYDMDGFDKVNWLINQDMVGKVSPGDGEDYTYGDVQTAIWELLGLELPPLGGTIIHGALQERVDELVELANEFGEGFVPRCGDRIAIVLKPEGAQNLIIEFPVPCTYGEETAWGDGCRFVDRGNWAMYFKVCPPPPPVND